MYLWRKVLLFSFNLLRQRHDISVLLFIVHGHALWRGRMSEFGPIRNHYHVHLVDHSARAGCSTFCCATPCWREPTSSKQLSTVAAFCWFSVWSLSCRCRVKFSTQSSLAEIWVNKGRFEHPPPPLKIYLHARFEWGSRIFISHFVWFLQRSALKPLRRNPSSHEKETDIPCVVSLFFTVPLAGGWSWWQEAENQRNNWKTFLKCIWHKNFSSLFCSFIYTKTDSKLAWSFPNTIISG